MEASVAKENVQQCGLYQDACTDKEIFDKRENFDNHNKTSKHRTTFNSSWLTSFPWLKHSSYNDKDVLLCQLCIQHHSQNTKFPNSPWIKNGCVTVRLDKIKDHQKSQMHTISVAAEASFLDRNDKDEENSKSFKAVLAAMKCLEFLVKHNLPHVSLFEEFINFAIFELESPLLALLKKAKNANYTSYTSINDFLDTMSSVKEEEILEDIKKSPCFSIMVDETSDVNNRKHMAVGVKYLKDGKNKISFVQDSELADGKAATIFSALTPVIEKCGGIEKISGFVSDGASSMIGQNEGIVAKLKRENSKIIPVNCMNHRLALATKNSFESLTRFVKIDEILTATYKYYKYSTVRTNSLLNSSELFSKRKGVTIKRVGFTRWLSHDAAVNSIRINYESILVDLENAEAEGQSSSLAGPTASGLLKHYKSYEFFQGIHFLCDVLAVISKLNLYLQKNETDLASMEAHIQTSLVELRRLCKKPGGAFSRKLDQRARKLNIIAPIINVNSKFETDAQIFIDCLCEKISKRLDNEGVITNLAILDLREASEDEHYGNSQIIELSEYFEFHEDELLNEWRDMKDVFLKSNFDKSTLTIPTVCTHLFKLEITAGERFPLMKKLLSIASTLPISNAEVERIFSQLKLVLTDNRNRLKVETVNKLMLLKLNDGNGYLTKAVKKWKKIKVRRLY